MRSTEFEQQMSLLEAEIKRLEAEYNMFFAGRLPRLPWETRARVDALVKRYDRMQIRNTAQKFRFGTLQARYVAFSDLWERNLRAREEGRPQRGRRTASHTAPAAPAATPDSSPALRDAPGDPPARVVGVTAFRDPAAEAERLEELYQRLSAARKEAGEKPVPFESFKQVVHAQVSKLGGGTSEVAFRVAVEDGKVTLTAKALKGAE
ncbi:MAG TPA: MXAN_5187 C-terminal domain-containing protein [Vicinamibacterales bacterium]|nr:MXAN_5187 C-terminal domain-containing protein [Vicinamibacterales bacterium]